MSATPLEKKLRLLIEANGPMTIADYMAHCLGDPAHGYYMTRDPFGADGDFITAPDVSQMFGEIVCAWLIESWRLAGSPSPVRLVELGPGRGTLMTDILRVAAKVSEFRAAVSVHLVETSPALKARQAETLAPFGADVRWHASFTEVPKGSLLLAANEFFDALPIRQFVRADGAWRERVVGLDADGRLAFGIGARSLPLPLGERSAAQSGRRMRGPSDRAPDSRTPSPDAFGVDLSPMGRGIADVPESSILELRPAAGALIAEIAGRIVEHGGAALVIDYGHATSGLGDTLQAVRGHAYADPLTAPGEADLTAHVDFAALARSARSEGAAVHGPIAQGDFLRSLGLLERAGRLGAEADSATRETLHAAVERLAGTDQMGTLFKVLALTRPGIRPPPFLAAV